MQALEKYQPFKTTGDDFADSNPIFAYFFYTFFIGHAENICISIEDPDEKAKVNQEIMQVQALVPKLQGKSQIKLNQSENLSGMLEYTELMFAKNQHQYSNSFRSKQMAEDYLTIHRLYEVIKHFLGLNEQQNKRRVFAKKRFIEMMKQLKNKPQQQAPPPPPPKPIQQKIKASVFKAPLPKPTTVVSYDKIQMQMEANKRLENAISELSFDRFKFAKEQVIHALELLEQLAE